MVKVWHSVLHAIRSANPVMLSGAKHLSHHSAHCHFDRALPPVISTFRLTVISTERSEWRNLPNRPATCLFCAPQSFRPFASQSFRPCRPPVISTERFTVISTERSEWRNLYASYARHRRRNMRSPTTTAQALRGARPQRALLAPGCCLSFARNIVVLWIPNALTINYLTINTVGQKYPPC